MLALLTSAYWQRVAKGDAKINDTASTIDKFIPLANTQC